MLNRTIAPPIHDAIEFKYNLPPITEATLDNGIPFYWLSAGVQDVVEIDWVFPAGSWQEPKPAVANATATLLKNGTSKCTAHQVSEAIEFYGANMRVNAGDDYATVSLFALTKDLPKLLPIIHEMLTDAVFPEEEVLIYKQNAIQRLQVSLSQAPFVANQRIDAMLFGEAHPYGRYSKTEKIEALTREDLLNFYKSAYSLANAKIFMGGKVGRTEVSLINTIFGKEPTGTTSNEEIVFGLPAPGERSIREINDDSSVQASIRIGRIFPNRHHPDFAKMVVLNTMLGGYFGSRLMSNIREDKGYTYGIYSSLQPLLHSGSLTIHSEVNRDVLEEVVKEVYHELDALCVTPAPAEELLLVKNYLLGGLLGDLDGPFQILSRWRTLILNGLGAAHFNQNIDTYKTVNAAELQALAQKYYDRSAFFEIGVI